MVHLDIDKHNKMKTIYKFSKPNFGVRTQHMTLLLIFLLLLLQKKEENDATLQEKEKKRVKHTPTHTRTHAHIFAKFSEKKAHKQKLIKNSNNGLSQIYFTSYRIYIY